MLHEEKTYVKDDTLTLDPDLRCLLQFHNNFDILHLAK